jgi:hypothetical protein
LNHSEALSNGLITTSQNAAIFGADSSNSIHDGSGRASVRIESKKSYTHGLIVADIEHMPGSLCGVWPAFWTLGSGDWPTNGEIDIIEGVNLNAVNEFSMHTTDDCKMSNASETGTFLTGNCAVSNSTTGCTVMASGNNTYGNNFNQNNGGVYAMQWTSSFIKMWFFPRGSIPSDISSGSPDPHSWSLPQVNFQGPCDIDSHFKEHRIIFDLTFCGDWAGNVLDQTCPPQIGVESSKASCINYVANNPSGFVEA